MSATDADIERANQLMHEGLSAFARNEVQIAHDLLRQAATLHPKDEQVWLALLNVVEDDADKRVCLENILAINPYNILAQRHLRTINILQGAEYTELGGVGKLNNKIWVAQGLRLLVYLAILVLLFFGGVTLGILISLI